MAESEFQIDKSQYCTFSVAGMFFGIDVLMVQEVLRSQEITRVPQAPGVIEGLINLRGQIVTAVDMRKRLGVSPRAADVQPINIVVRTEDSSASLLVDEIGDVLEVEASAFELPPDHLPAQAREIIRGVCKLKDRLLLVLNTDRTLDLSASVQAHGMT